MVNRIASMFPTEPIDSTYAIELIDDFIRDPELRARMVGRLEAAMASDLPIEQKAAIVVQAISLIEGLRSSVEVGAAEMPEVENWLTKFGF